MRLTPVLPFILLILSGLELPVEGPLPAGKPVLAPSADTAAPQAGPAPDNSDPQPPGSGITAKTDSEAELKACERELERFGVSFERLPPVTGENGCGIGAPYAITEIARSVSLRPQTQLRCETALALARWVDGIVMASTAVLPKAGRLTSINHGSTYVCRRRNNLPTGKMSEHSIGNAIDIASFEFEDREPVQVRPRSGEGSFEEAFQRAVRAGACLHFTTVLGPGADTSHDEHLHLDIAERKRGYRICQ